MPTNFEDEYQVAVEIPYKDLKKLYKEEKKNFKRLHKIYRKGCYPANPDTILHSMTESMYKMDTYREAMRLQKHPDTQFINVDLGEWSFVREPETKKKKK